MGNKTVVLLRRGIYRLIDKDDNVAGSLQVTGLVTGPADGLVIGAPDDRHIADQLAQAKALLRDLTEHPPTFRDYAGTDEDTCGYCHEPLEGFDGRTKGAHHPDCKWAKARAFLDGGGAGARENIE